MMSGLQDIVTPRLNELFYWLVLKSIFFSHIFSSNCWTCAHTLCLWLTSNGHYLFIDAGNDNFKATLIMVVVMLQTRCPACVFAATRRPPREASEPTSKVSFTKRGRRLHGKMGGWISVEEFFLFRALFSSEEEITFPFIILYLF